MNGGCQIGRKLWLALGAARQLKRVLTITTVPSPSTAMSWMSQSPVVKPSWGT